MTAIRGTSNASRPNWEPESGLGPSGMTVRENSDELYHRRRLTSYGKHEALLRSIS